MQIPNKGLRILKETDQMTWAYPVQGLESALIESGLNSVVHGQDGIMKPLLKAASRLGLIRNLNKRNGCTYFATLMGPAEYRLFPYSYFNDVILCCFDCWPNYFERWESIFRRNRTGLAFFTARQSAEYFTERLPGMRSVWMPEAVDHLKYDGSKPLSKRSIDVLELGRRHEPYHDRIRDWLLKRGYRHLYENPGGRIIFRSRSEMVSGLGDAKLSVCFPGSITSPGRCGDVETVTHRYFESMASKCLIVGRCPRELSDLFGYNPVIEADLSDPISQLEGILSRPADFQSLVERNYSRMLEVGIWKRRAELILEETATYFSSRDHIGQ